MTSMLLAETTPWINWVLIGVVALLLIALPILMNARNKKETQKVQEQTNSLKVGDKVLTTSGVYGTITELKFDDTQKVVVLETGGKIKSYLSVDAYAIYTVFKSDAELKREAEEKEAKEKAEAENKTADEKTVEEVKETEQKTEKKTTKKKKSTAKKDEKTVEIVEKEEKVD